MIHWPVLNILDAPTKRYFFYKKITQKCRLQPTDFISIYFDPLTPMLAVTGRDEPWPFFHFWRHHFWPNLVSSMLNFCKRRRSFQSCPDQGDGPNFDFCACPSQNVAKHDASSKKAKLSCCKCVFDQIKANLAKIQPKNHQNVQEMPFSQKAPGVNELITWPNFPKDGSCWDKFAKPIPNKPQNARNSAKFGILAFLLTHWLPCWP